jgi:formate-dependent nitrite reductase membrane component NrfD
VTNVIFTNLLREKRFWYAASANSLSMTSNAEFDVVVLLLLLLLLLLVVVVVVKDPTWCHDDKGLRYCTSRTNNSLLLTTLL